MKEVKLDPILEGWLRGNQVEKEERMGQPEELGNYMKLSKSVGFGGAATQEMLLGNVVGVGLREGCLEEVNCDQECTTQVCNIKKPLSLLFILCWRPLVCLQGQRAVAELPSPSLIESWWGLGCLITLSVFMELLLCMLLQHVDFRDTTFRVMGIRVKWHLAGLWHGLSLSIHTVNNLDPWIRSCAGPWGFHG